MWYSPLGIVIHDMVMRYEEWLCPGTMQRPLEGMVGQDQTLGMSGGRVGCWAFYFHSHGYEKGSTCKFV